MKYCLLFFALLSFVFPAHASPGELPQQTVIETVFRMITVHHDGYEIGVDLVAIPPEVAKKCNGKKIRIAGTRLPQPTTDATGAPAKTRMSMDESRVIPDGPTFKVASITIWNEKKQRWDVAYCL